MMLPYMVGFTLFTILPVLISLYLSFTSFNMLQFPKFVGFNNYLTLFLDDEIFITAIKNTLVIAVICGPFGYLLSLRNPESAPQKGQTPAVSFIS